MENFVSFLMLAIPVLYASLQTLLLRQWNGFYQRLATLPLAGWAVWGTVLAYRYYQGASVRTQIPGEVFTFAALGLVYLGTLAGMRHLMSRNPDGQG